MHTKQVYKMHPNKSEKEQNLEAVLINRQQMMTKLKTIAFNTLCLPWIKENKMKKEAEKWADEKEATKLDHSNINF